MNKVLLFDFDGTIADSFENFIGIIDILAKKYKFKTIPTDELEELRSGEIKALMKRLKIPMYTIPFMARDMKKMQQQQIKNIKPFAGLTEVLRKLKSRGHVLGILTSNGKENVEFFIKNNNIDVFDYVYSDASIFGKDKGINKFLKQHMLTKTDVVYIGDEIRDIQACQKVGVKIIAVTWGFNTKAGLTKYTPDFLIDKPDELLAIVI